MELIKKYRFGFTHKPAVWADGIGKGQPVGDGVPIEAKIQRRRRKRIPEGSSNPKKLLRKDVVINCQHTT